MSRKILVDCTIKGSGGSVTYYKNLINRLVELENEHEVNVFYFLVNEGLKGMFSDQVLLKSKIITESKLTGFKRYWWLRNNLSEIKLEIGASLLFVPYQMSVGFSIIPQVLMLRNMEPFGYRNYPYSVKEFLRNSLLRVLSLRALRRANSVIAVSDFVKEYLIESHGFNEKFIQRIHHGIDQNYGEAEKSNNNSSISHEYILSSGSFRPYRRYEDLIEAFNLFKRKSSDGTLQLVIAGRGLKSYMDKIQKLIQKSPFSKDIIYRGFVDKDVMVSLYQNCLFYVATTEIEACPNIAIESLKCAVPVISANTAPLKEIYNGTVLYYAQRDVLDLSRKMNLLNGDSDLRGSLASKALLRSNEFSWDKCAQETYNYLTTLIKE